jgi:hypothetical protein
MEESWTTPDASWGVHAIFEAKFELGDVGGRPITQQVDGRHAEVAEMFMNEG